MDITNADLKMRRWYDEDGDPHEQIEALLKHLEVMTNSRLDRYKEHLSIYMNRDVSGISPGEYTPDITGRRRTLNGREPLRINTLENCLATLGSRIASQRPRAQFLTSTDGTDSWTLKTRAKNLEKFVAGTWHTAKVYVKAIDVFFDGGIFGLGGLKVFPCDGVVKFERTFPGEIIVDEQSCMTSEPRSLYQVKVIPASVLESRYPKHKKEIQDAVGQIAYGYVERTETDLVQVIEAWHLPSGKKAKDGRHSITIAGATLFDEKEWKGTRFPFAFFKWSRPRIGWFPQGMIENQEPLQQFVNYLLERMQRAAELHSQLKIFVQKNSINKGALTNRDGDIVEVNGPVNQAVRVDMPPSMPASFLNWIEMLDNKHYQTTGVSQLSAAGLKPAGVESGVALRTLQDVESGRHALLNLAWEDFFIDLAELTVETAKSIGGSLSTKYVEGKNMVALKWSDVDMERDKYELKIFPTNMLPTTPAGRLAMVQELMEVGLVSGKEALSLLQFPDTEQFTSLSTAALDDVDWIIDKILTHGEYVDPEPYQDFATALPRATSALFRARQDGAPGDRVEMLENWIDEARRMDEDMKRQLAEMQGQGQQEAAPPMGAMPNLGPATMQAPEIQLPPQAGGPTF